MNQLRESRAVLILVVALIIAAIAYYPGLKGTLHFDDSANLGALKAIAAGEPAFLFIAEGSAGPLGRPLALASFIPQAYAWPDAPDVFLYVNVCLHLLNGVLVAWLMYLISTARQDRYSRATYLASMGAAIWMVLPLLASSSLLIVQRMTLLSATFLLVGLIGYLLARRILTSRPKLAMSLMTMAIVVGGTLSALAKENGATLPLLVLILEVTLLPRPERTAPLWRVWFFTLLVLPAIALLGYLALHVQYSDRIVLWRGFTGLDRLLTEAHILWKYLYLAFLPRVSALGPFHDDQTIYSDWLSPLSLLTVVAWLLLIALAVLYRRRAPLLLFGLGWFLLAHSLESTVLPLELYFEHRNYIPLIGPVFALVAAVSASPVLQLSIKFGLAAYASLLAVVLFHTTSLWGRPDLAGEIWAIHHPTSSRAIQYLAQQIEKTGDLPTVRRILEAYLEDDPKHAGVGLQVLALSCVLQPSQPQQPLLADIRKNLSLPRFEPGVFHALRLLQRVSMENECQAIQPDTAYELASIAAANPAFQAVPIVHHNLHVLMAEEAFELRDLDLVMRHLESALESRYTLTTVSLAVQMLNSAGLHSVALEFAQEAMERQPLHPLRAIHWRQNVDKLIDATVQRMRASNEKTREYEQQS